MLWKAAFCDEVDRSPVNLAFWKHAMARKKSNKKSDIVPPSVKVAVARSEPAGIYDTLLFVSLGFLLSGIMFLVLELMKYGFVIKP